MAGLIVETHVRGVNHFYKVNEPVVTIGRALDNDIILSDLSVSAHHLRIEKDGEGQVIATNLSHENGTRIGKQKLALNEGRRLALPAELWLGMSKLRLLASDMAVEPTRVRQCSGWFCLYTSPVWATVLLLMALGLIIFDQVMGTALDKPLGQYLESSFASILFLLGFFLVIAGISRLATHRWEVVPAMSVAALLFVIPQLVDYIGHFFSYYFSSDLVRTVPLNLVNFLLLPALLTIFMIRIAHTHYVPAIAISLLVSIPVIAYLEEDFLKELTRSDFSPLPSYNQTLSPWDIRLEQTISIVDFAEEAEEMLAKSVLREVDEKTP